LVQERVVEPDEVLDITGLPMSGITSDLDGVRIGALTRLQDIADDPTIQARYTAVAEALAATASPQVRHLATAGGNLLQRTRCPYFRDVATPCNKREPGTGCPAQDGVNRINAILGGSEHCIAVQPSDFAVALVACDAEVVISGADGERTVPAEQFHRLPGDTPHIETVLDPGELITSLWLPERAGRRLSRYLKVRDRASFEWALASCAVSLALENGAVSLARIAVGGVATKPWRLAAVEQALVGQALTTETIEAAAALATDGAAPRHGNAYKVPMLRAVVRRALVEIGGLA
jgi:xanthine dehydrogenase YagS FAD-binding subunit